MEFSTKKEANIKYHNDATFLLEALGEVFYTVDGLPRNASHLNKCLAAAL